MKKLILFAMIAIAFASCEQKSFKIEGTIEGVKDGQALLKKISDNRPVTADSAKIVDGKFTFTGNETQPQLYLIYINEIQRPIMFFGENKNISIEANSEKLNDAVISGSPLTDILTNFIKGIPLQDRIEQIQGEYQQAATANDQEKVNALRKEMGDIIEEQKAYVIKFTKENTDNAVGANLLLQVVNEFDLDELKSLISEYEKNLGEHIYVAQLKEALEPIEKSAEIEKATAIGEIAPDFTLKSPKGEEISLSSLKGKIVLVDFWASWCRPCREENPNVVKAYNEFAPKGFDIISVSLDRDSSAWVKAIEDDGLTWNQVIDPEGKTATSYGVSNIPFTLLLDKDGKIIAKNVRGEDLTSKLSELLK